MSKPIRFVGLDVHSRTIAIVELPSAGQGSVPPRDIPTDPTSIRQTFSRMKKRAQVRCCYEAGPCGFDLYRHLEALRGNPNIQPAEIDVRKSTAPQALEIRVSAESFKVALDRLEGR